MNANLMNIMIYGATLANYVQKQLYLKNIILIIIKG